MESHPAFADSLLSGVGERAARAARAAIKNGKSMLAYRPKK